MHVMQSSKMNLNASFSDKNLLSPEKISNNSKHVLIIS